jgi:hypothetical protein
LLLLMQQVPTQTCCKWADLGRLEIYSTAEGYPHGLGNIWMTIQQTIRVGGKLR